MKSFVMAKKWLYLGTVLFGILLFYMALQVPLNYWHHSKFGHEIDFTFNDYFPLIHLFGWFLSSSNTAPINELNYNIYSYLSALFATIALFLFLATIARKFKTEFLVIVAFALVGQLGFLWLLTISLNLALSCFGIALLFWVLGSRNLKNKLVFTALLSLSFAAIIGSSAFWPVFVLGTLPFAVIHKENTIKILISIILGFGIVYLSDPHFLFSYNQYFKTNLLAFFTYNGASYLGEDLPYSYALVNMIKFMSPTIFIMLLLVLAFYKAFARQWYQPPFLISLLGVLLVFLQPTLTSKANYSFFVYSIPFLLLGLQAASKIAERLHNKILKWSFVTILLIVNYKGVFALFNLSPYQYFEPTAPFAKLGTEIVDNQGEYLNMAGLVEMKKTLSNANPGDTIGLNFAHNLAFAEGSFITVDYFKRDLKQYTKGVFTRLAFNSKQQRSQGFPTSERTSSTSYKGITLALTCKPLRRVKKAFALIEQRKIGQAVTDFKVLKDTFSKNVEVWYGLAKAQFIFNQWDNALSSSQMGLSLNPDYLKLNVLLGEIYRKQNKNEMAVNQWKSSLKIWQSFGRTHWLLGEYYYRMDSFDQAENYFLNAKYCAGAMADRAIKSLELLKRRKEDPRFNHGVETYFIDKINAFDNITDTDLARLNHLIDEIKVYIDLDSTNAQLRSHLGIAYMMKPDFARAALAFEKAIEINPNYPQMRDYLSIARINWGAEKFEEDSIEAAIFHFRYALDYSPNNESARANLSVCYNELATKALEDNALEEAYSIIRAAIFYNQNNPVSFLQMGRLQLAINQTDSAEIAFNQAYLIDNNNEEVIEELIRFYDKKGDKYKVKVFNDRMREAKKRNQKKKQVIVH